MCMLDICKIYILNVGAIVSCVPLESPRQTSTYVMCAWDHNTVVPGYTNIEHSVADLPSKCMPDVAIELILILRRSCRMGAAKA